jgi:pyruvate formate lyase activating enzyme
MKPTPCLIGSVLRVERSSIHDGKGLRTVVFLKGLPSSLQLVLNTGITVSCREKGYV